MRAMDWITSSLPARIIATKPTPCSSRDVLLCNSGAYVNLKMKPKREEESRRIFKSAAEFREWLRTNHKKCDVLWMRIFKKTSGERPSRTGQSITYAEALDEALCFGWIDGQKKSCDERS